MTTQHIIEPGQAVHQAAAILLLWSTSTKRKRGSLGPLAVAVANAFMVVYYR